MNKFDFSCPNTPDGYDIRLKSPFTLQLIGPSNSSKTTWLLQLLEHLDELVYPRISNVFYCFSQWNTAFERFPHINFIEGFPGEELLSDENLEIGSGKHNLLIIDDLIHTLLKSQLIGQIWTCLSHHKLLSCCLVQQNYYPKGFQCGTDINRNSTYRVIFKNNSERLQTVLLGRSMFPGQSKFWNEVVTDVFSKPWSYLFINNRNDTPEPLRLLSNLFPTEGGVVCYVPKASKGY